MNLKTTILIFVSLTWISVNAQIINPKERAKRKVEDKANQKIDETIDNGLDKIEEGIGDILKGKKKKEKNNDPKPRQTTNNSDNNVDDVYDPPKTKTDNNGNTDYSPYKNFSFIPGEQIIFFEDFKDGSKSRWGAYDIDNEVNVANFNGTNWLEVKSGAFYPLGLKALPKNFTLEFDVYTPDIYAGSLDIRFVDQSQSGALGDPWLDNSSQVTFSPKTQMPKTGLGSYQRK